MAALAQLKDVVVTVLKSVQAAVGRPSWAAAGLQPPTTGERLLARISPKAPALEIGPFNAPALTGPEVRYFDVLDREGLQQRAVEHGRDPANTPEIHYISACGDLSIIRDTFASVVSIHVIEHQPDLIGHLQAVTRLLRPGGAYYLIIPDKRYCFDHYLPESRLSEIWAAHLDGRKLHSARSILDHRIHLTHNSPLRHWLGRHQPGSSPSQEAQALAECRAAAEGKYIDVHAWQFTPMSFLRSMQELRQRELISLRVAAVHATAFGELDFAAVLTRDGPG